MSTEWDGWTPSFPGLELHELTGSASSAIERSAMATIRSLDSAGLLTDRHALTCQLVLELSRAVGRGLAYGKVTVATATLSKQLLEAIDSLPAPAEDESDVAALERFAAQLSAL